MAPRPPLGNVLVATDFSAAGTRAVERAGRLPLGSGSTLTVLHVPSPGCEPDERAELAGALDRAASLAARCVVESGSRHVRVEARVREGKPFVEIIREAREGDNELIVVGRHGRRSFRDLVLGSTAERVIRKGRTSVLVVTASVTGAYGHPLVAVDLSEGSRHALDMAWRLVGSPAVTLKVVHAYDVISEAAIQRAGFSWEDGAQYRLDAERHVDGAVRGFLAAADVGDVASVIAREGEARSVILDVAAEHPCDLLALGAHGRSTAVQVLIGSVAEAVVRAARCDVLVASAPTPFELP